jgi:hypothetical protein
MTLYKKISNTLKGVMFQYKTRDDYTVELAAIADEWAIEFAEWVNKRQYDILGDGNWLGSQDPYRSITSETLIEQFKKEKGL